MEQILVTHNCLTTTSDRHIGIVGTIRMFPDDGHRCFGDGLEIDGMRFRDMDA